MTLCKPFVEKSSKDSNKIYINYLQGFHIKTISENIYQGFHFRKFGCCKPKTFPKKLHHGFLVGVW